MYICDLIKQECWDGMSVKGKSIKASIQSKLLFMWIFDVFLFILNAWELIFCVLEFWERFNCFKLPVERQNSWRNSRIEFCTELPENWSGWSEVIQNREKRRKTHLYIVTQIMLFENLLILLFSGQFEKPFQFTSTAGNYLYSWPAVSIVAR